MKVHLIDGTYELFRQYFGRPSHLDEAGREVAATRGVLTSVAAMLADGVTHIGVATDHVIESFRNEMWPGYKSSAGVDSELLAQFPLLEEGLVAMGVAVFAMVELEADDALASLASACSADAAVERVIVMTPDKDLAQCVTDDTVVQFDRKSGNTLNEQAIVARWGVLPQSIPDYLALVGDSSDGFPGLPGWGAKSASALLAEYVHLEEIPVDAADWKPVVRQGAMLSKTLVEWRDKAMLFRDLATLRIDSTLIQTVDDLRWKGPSGGLAEFAESIDAAQLAESMKILGKG